MLKWIFLALITATTAQAQVELVIERKPTHAFLYLAMPAELGPNLLGLDLATGDITAEEITQSLILRTLETEVPLTPNAMVLHPASDPIPFDAPWDASTAVQFGGALSAVTDTPRTLYARVDALQLDAEQALSISFPNSTKPSATLETRDFVRDQVRDRIRQDLAAGAVVLLPDVHANKGGTRLTIAFGVLFVLTLAYDFWRRRRAAAHEKTPENQ